MGSVLAIFPIPQQHSLQHRRDDDPDLDLDPDLDRDRVPEKESSRSPVGDSQ
jgi:hypothetical protein